MPIVSNDGEQYCHCEQCTKEFEKALVTIAAFGDEGANARLARDGSFASFDSPTSVQIARQVLAENRAHQVGIPVVYGRKR